MDHTTLIRRPRLRGPVLLAAFDGWNDAGEAATSALAGQTEAFDAAVTELIDDNPELAGYIERLEADSDEDEDEEDDDGSPGLADLPPEELVAEVERYLRDHPGGTRG